MDTIPIRYGEALTLGLDTDDITDLSATLYVGKPGEVPLIEKPITLVAGKGTFELAEEDTRIPLGTYAYQINVITVNGSVCKVPEPDADCAECDDALPEFIVSEALDEQETP